MKFNLTGCSPRCTPRATDSVFATSVRIQRRKLMKQTLFVLLATVAILLGAAAQANAGSITYQVSDISSGSIAGTAFSNALVTISFVGDTSNVTSRPEIFQNTVGTGSVTISGIGTFSI